LNNGNYYYRDIKILDHIFYGSVYN
jgi:hypothetical protein